VTTGSRIPVGIVVLPLQGLEGGVPAIQRFGVSGASRAYVTAQIQAMTRQLVGIDGLLADLHGDVRYPGQPIREHERSATAMLAAGLWWVAARR
jgi:hypothetical protein